MFVTIRGMLRVIFMVRLVPERAVRECLPLMFAILALTYTVSSRCNVVYLLPIRHGR